MKFNKHGVAQIPKRKLSRNTLNTILMTIHYSKAMERTMGKTLRSLTKDEHGLLDDLRISDGKIQ